MPRKNGKLAISRRTLLIGGVALGVLPSRRAFSQPSEPLKVGFLTVNTGPLAAGGKQQMEGAAFYLKERGGMIAGRKVELITEDTAGNPALARTKTQELVERYRVPVMIGPLATNEALAIDSYIRDAKVPLITTTSAATVDLKSHAVNPWVLHAFGTAPQVTYPLGDYAAKTLGYKRMAIVAEDFTYGHEGAGGFHLAFEAAGGKIVQKLWPPLNTPDYAPYLAQIRPDLDGIYMGFAGSNPLRFLKQIDDYGLKGKIAVLGNTTSTDEGILKLMGEEAVDTFTAGWYAAGLDTADNKKFVAGINADYQHDPGFYTAGPYTALLIIEEALKAIGGKTDDAAAFLSNARCPLEPRTDRTRTARRIWDSGSRYLHPQSGAREWEARQHHRQDLSAGEPVLDLQPRAICHAADVLARLSAKQKPGIAAKLVFPARLPAQAFLRESGEVILPDLRVIAAELVEIIPAVDSGRMHVIEDEPHRIIADGMHFQNGNVLLAADGLALIRRMSLHLGARALHPQIFGAQIEGVAAVEDDAQGLAVLAQPQLRWPGL